MIGAESLGFFLVASVAILLVPGPVVLYIIARSLHQGRNAGLVSAAAGATGNAVHALAAALGLSAIIASSALAFGVVKYLGAAYLIYIGIRTLLSKEEVSLLTPPPRALAQIYRQGVMVAVFNPKTALFFLAFLPQFINPALGSAGAQAFALGLIYTTLGMVTDSGYAVVAGGLGQQLAKNLGFLRGQRYFAGSVFVVLGLTAAFTGERK